MIFNLAKAKLTTCEKEVLCKGLKFCPTPDSNKITAFDMAINELNRKITGLLCQGIHRS
jgi:hypothetical protein